MVGAEVSFAEVLFAESLRCTHFAFRILVLSSSGQDKLKEVRIGRNSLGLLS